MRWASSPAQPAGQDFPAVLSIRDRAEFVLRITQKRLDQLIPKLMRETGFDMWIIAANEDNLDPVFMTMIPYENWCPIAQIIVFYDQGPEKGVERLNISRTDMQGLFESVWDAAAWDTKKKESQWDCLGRIVRERDPKKIGINEGEVQWAAGGLTVVLKKRLADLGLKISFTPSFTVRGRHPQDVEKYGKDDKVIRPGDFIHCDVGLKYMHYNSDHQEWAYVLKVGETDVPETFKKIMAECNKLQNVYSGEFKAGLTGNELLAAMLKKAKEQGIPSPRIYSHSLGYFLHEPGPLIGLPWEQVNNPGRGDVRLVPNSCFTAEMSVTMPVPERGGQDFRLSLEQDVVFTERGVFFLDGRQTTFHLIK